MVKVPSKSPASNQPGVDNLTTDLSKLAASAPAVTKPQPQQVKIKRWETILKHILLSTPVFSSKSEREAQSRSSSRTCAPWLCPSRPLPEADHRLRPSAAPSALTTPLGQLRLPAPTEPALTAWRASATAWHVSASAQHRSHQHSNRYLPAWQCPAQDSSGSRGSASGRVQGAPQGGRKRNRRNKAARQQAQYLHREQQLQRIRPQLDELKKLSVTRRKPESRQPLAVPRQPSAASPGWRIRPTGVRRCGR
jgi:hypothetical protein